MNTPKVVTGFSVSLDGFIAGPGDDVDRLFDWYARGDVDVPFPSGRLTVHVSPASAQHIRDVHFSLGALVTGRRMFDLMKGWGGRHPTDVPVFVVTHRPPPAGWENTPFTFVTEGVAQAIEQAKAVAGNRAVGVDGASIVQQAIRAGLVDELGLDLVPVLLGSGVRYFDQLGPDPIELERIEVIDAPGVTHIRYRVVK